MQNRWATVSIYMYLGAVTMVLPVQEFSSWKLDSWLSYLHDINSYKAWYMFLYINLYLEKWSLSGIILCMHPANERWCYIVISSLTGWGMLKMIPDLYSNGTLNPVHYRFLCLFGFCLWQKNNLFCHPWVPCNSRKQWVNQCQTQALWCELPFPGDSEHQETCGLSYWILAFPAELNIPIVWMYITIQ